MEHVDFCLKGEISSQETEGLKAVEVEDISY